ncbi:MAG: hypothetical protein ACJ79J_05205 [Gemmatimonadaceae bacterium]
MRLASRGQRDMDKGPEPILDASELGQVRRQASGVYVKAVITAVILTAIVVLL